MRRVRRRVFSVGLLVAASLAGARAGAHPLAHAPNCPIFPSNNPWNQRVDGLAVARNSALLIRTIGLGRSVHPDFGSGLYNGEPIGIPFAVVSKHTPRVRISFDYASESDGGFYPIPRNVPIEGGASSSGDRHVIVVDRDSCKDYELFSAYARRGGASWHAGSGAIFNLRSNHLRPAGWTSADAAGLPILPGLARYDEVARGVIDHALRFTADRTRMSYVYPARHYASSSNDPSLPAMGLRVRLKAKVDISHLPRQARTVAQALKRYGMILADNGSPWYVWRAPHRHWNNDDLHQLGDLGGRDFEVVDTASRAHPGL
jgi:hypothetical protein